jgi:crossover junction endodeoxyribonuclease RuvC
LKHPRKIILGVDPGTVVMGYSILHAEGPRMDMAVMDTVRLRTGSDMFDRLHTVHQTLLQLIDRHRPTQLAIEAPFYGKNVQSMLKLGRAQGVAIAAALGRGMEVAEYSPRRIKQAITGNGNASKEQVWQMLKRILKVTEDIRLLDASDALAVAVCHHFESMSPTRTEEKPKRGPKSGWEDFIRQNPGRVTGTAQENLARKKAK